MRRHYQNSTPAKWLRTKVFKIEKPYALEWGKWDDWKEETKKKHPIGFFFTETLPDIIEWIPEHSIDYVDKARYYVVNRFNNSHCLTSTLKKGSYHEFSERMFYSLFDSFVNFIETEEAYMHVSFSKEEDRKKYNIPWWFQYRFFRWIGRWNSTQAAIDHIKWEMTLDVYDPSDPHWVSSPYQAESAREKMALYTWWKHVRPLRLDSWEESGMSAFTKKMEEKYGENIFGFASSPTLTATERRTYDKLSQDKNHLEESWFDEDTDMMIRLIRIRRNLWT